MGGGYVEGFLQLVLGDDVLHVIRQRRSEVVVYLAVGLGVGVVGGIYQQRKQRQEHRECLCDAPGQPVHVRDQRPVPGPLKGLVQQQDHGGKDGHAADHAQHHALGHHQAHIQAQLEAHEAQGHEASHRGDGGAHDAGERQADGPGHGLLVVGTVLELLVVAVPQEDGVVHGHRQLQHRGQRHGDEGDLPQQQIGAHVVEYRHADGSHEHQRHQEAVQQQHHGQYGQPHGDGHVDGLLVLANILQVQHHGGHAGNEALLAANTPDLLEGLHGTVFGGGAVEEHRYHGGVVGIEGVVELLGQHLHGDGHVREAVVPDGGVHMVHGLDLLLESGHVPMVHALDNDK